MSGAGERMGQATRHELAEGARRHYERVSREATDWLSTIPHAIDAWEREPDLLARADALATAAMVPMQRCRFCDVAAPDPDRSHVSFPHGFGCALAAYRTHGIAAEAPDSHGDAREPHSGTLGPSDTPGAS